MHYHGDFRIGGEVELAMFQRMRQVDESWHSDCSAMRIALLFFDYCGWEYLHKSLKYERYWSSETLGGVW